MPVTKVRVIAAALMAAAMLTASPAGAELLVSQLVVEFKSGAQRTSDVEVTNNSPDRAYVLVEPREVLNPGTPSEKSVTLPDPSKLGLLVSPARFILEPQQRRTVRIAGIGGAADKERVYRVTIKPVIGDVSGSDSGLKLLVGYDLLVLVRPAALRKDVRAERNGMELTLTNTGNASVELAEGKQCEADGERCEALPGKRLYAGASWTQRLLRSGGGEYRIRFADGWSSVKFD